MAINYPIKNCRNCNNPFQPTCNCQFYCSLKCIFWPKVEIKGSDECWEWTKGKTLAGYGLCGIHRQRYYAHRLAYEFTYGPLPEGLHACHHCDNPGCCNPSHIFAGTPKDNMQDMYKKGRHPGVVGLKGSDNGMAKLTDENVKTIKTLLKYGYKQPVIAEIYSVHRKTISRINTGETRSHI